MKFYFLNYLTGSLIDVLVKFSIQEFTSILIPTTGKLHKEKLTHTLKNAATILRYLFFLSHLKIPE